MMKPRDRSWTLWLACAAAVLAFTVAGCLDARLTVDARDLDEPVMYLDVESDPLLTMMWEGYLGTRPWHELARSLSEHQFEVETPPPDASGLRAHKRLDSIEELPEAVAALLAAVEPVWVLPLGEQSDQLPNVQAPADPLGPEEGLLFKHYRLDWPIYLPSPLPADSWQEELLSEVRIELDVHLSQVPHASNAGRVLEEGTLHRWRLKPGHTEHVALEFRQFQPHPGASILLLALMAGAYLAWRFRQA